MSTTASPHDLLYAMMALQLELLSLDEVQSALHQCDSGAGLREVLFESGKLRPQQYKLVGALVEAHLSAGDGVASRSLDTIGQTSIGQAAIEQRTDRNHEDTISFDGSTQRRASADAGEPG